MDPHQRHGDAGLLMPAADHRVLSAWNIEGRHCYHRENGDTETYIMGRIMAGDGRDHMGNKQAKNEKRLCEPGPTKEPVQVAHRTA